MLYQVYEIQRNWLNSVSSLASMSSEFLNSPSNPLSHFKIGGIAANAFDVMAHATAYYGKPAFGITEIDIDGTLHPVEEATVVNRPFGDLKRFRHTGLPETAPRLLIVAPMSGHYATLLRGTVEAFLPTHEVYITDWTDARMAPVWFGRFDLDDYIDHIRMMLEVLGQGAHVVAVCQPGPPVLAAISMMAEDGSDAMPATMTYMGSPIDARRSPTVPNRLSEERSLDWFRSKMIHTVPPPWPGAFRRVYPGFVQLTSFMHMNWDRHVDAQARFFDHLVEGDGDGADKHKTFYDEYLAVLDLTEEFYIQTIERVFQKCLLARGEYRYRDDRLVKPGLIETVGLMTVEGELDDISGIGQTQAAHDLCTSIPDGMKVDYVQPGVGHYGVFNGSRFRKEIVPRVIDFQQKVVKKK